jgi:hypothetical protein
LPVSAALERHLKTASDAVTQARSELLPLKVAIWGYLSFLTGKKMKTCKSVIAILTIGALMLSVAACKPEPGPAEKAGQKIDEALGTAPKDKTLGERAGEKVEKAGQDIQDASKK